MNRYPALRYQVRQPAREFRPEPRGREWLLGGAALGIILLAGYLVSL